MSSEVFWGGLMLIWALGTGLGCFHFIRRGARVKRYITTEGTLLSARMTRDSGSSGKTYYKPIMKYTYTVDGKEYTSRSVIFGRGEYTSIFCDDIEKMINHPVGGPITVFYDPDKPDKSFLDKKASNPDLGAIVFLAIVTIFFDVMGILTITGKVSLS